MKRLLIIALLAASGAAHAGAVEIAGCMNLAASMRSVALARDRGMPRAQSHAIVDSNPGEGEAKALAHDLVDLIYAHKDLTPEQLHDAGYAGCIEKLRASNNLPAM